MSKTDEWENGMLLLLFNNIDFANVGDATGLRGSTTAGNLYLSLHENTGPGEGGNQSSNEVDYTNYVRKAVARSSGGWTVSGSGVTLTADQPFPQGSSGTTPVATYFGVGTDSSGTGTLLYYGAINPSIQCGQGITPILTTSTQITED